MKWIARLMMLWLVVSLFSLSGCGGGGDDEETIPGLITNVGWVYDNLPADLSSSPLELVVWVYYDQAIAVADIESFTAIAPDGTRWTVPASNSRLGTGSRGRPYLSARLVHSQTPGRLPLAGTWAFSLKLKKGISSPYRLKFHEPGSSADATHPYVYAKEDYTPFTNPSQHVAALGRFTSYGYTVQYSSAGGGSISSTGLADVRSTFLNSEPTAYNMYCLLYDANNVDLGYTITEYSTTDRSSTGLVTSGGELSISAASTTGANGPVDLSQVKYIRFVYSDGAQFAPRAGFDFRSVSYLVPVN